MLIHLITHLCRERLSMIGKRLYSFNRFDIILLFIIVSLWLGGLGVSLGCVRLLAILMFPLLLVSINKSRFYIKPFVVFFIVVEIYCIISLLWTSNEQQGVKEIVYNIIHFSLYLEIIVFSSLAKRPLNSISYGWIIAVLCCSVISIWEISTGQHLSDTYDYAEGGDRVIGEEIVEQFITAVTFGNYNSYVLFLCYSFPWMAYAYLESQGFKKRIIPFVAMLMAVTFVLYNASRGGMVSLIIMLTIYLFFYHKSVGKVFFALLIVGVVVFYLIQYAGDVVALVSYRMSGDIFKDSERTALLSDGLDILSSTFGVGVGVGGATTSLNMSPHNLLLEIALDYGVLFTLVFIWYLFRLFVKSVMQKNDKVRLVLLMSLVSLPFYSVINSTYILQPQLYVFLATLCVFANCDKIKKNYYECNSFK